MLREAPRGRDGIRKFSPSCGAGQGWGKTKPAGRGRRPHPSTLPRPIAIPTPHTPQLYIKKKKLPPYRIAFIGMQETIKTLIEAPIQKHYNNYGCTTNTITQRIYIITYVQCTQYFEKCFNLYSKNLHNNVHSKYTIFRKMLQSFTCLTYKIFSKKLQIQ